MIWFGTRQQLVKIDYAVLAEKFPSYAFSTSVRNRDDTLDSSLSFTDHISNLTRFCYYHLRRLKAILRSVSSLVFTCIVHAFICSRIDYCNSLFTGLPKVRLSPSQCSY